MYDDNPLRDSMIPVPGNHQDRVLTTRQFACYIELVRLYVAEHPDIRFVNVTDCGARINGMELAGSEFLADWSGPEFDAYRTVESLYSLPADTTSRQAHEQLLEIADYLEQVQSCCRRGAMAANRLLLMQRRPDHTDREEMRECLGVIIEVDDLLESGRKQCDFLQMSLWPAAYGLSAGRKEFAMNRMRGFYEQIAGAARWTRQLVLSACRELEAGRPEGKQMSMTGEDNGRIEPV